MKKAKQAVYTNYLTLPRAGTLAQYHANSSEIGARALSLSDDH
jgi:hypothetical protein